MIKTVKKWFWAWNDDKEEAFLEKMAGEGYRLIHVGLGRYTFEEDLPKSVKFQMDFKGLGKMQESEYLQIFEDAGWELVQRFGSWYYFSREIEEGEEPDVSIFNDNRSRLDKYRRIILFLILTGFPLYYNFIILFPNLEDGEFAYPGFYFFFRIAAGVLIILHAAAVIRIGYKIMKERKDIHE